MTPTAGAFPISGVGKLPNVDIAHPGEVWSNRRASGNIVPGACVAPIVGAPLKFKQVGVVGDVVDRRQVAIALRQVEIPDVNNGPATLGPNEIVNQMIADGDWLRTYHTGVLHLTLIDPDETYTAGDIIGWDAAANRPAGKAAGTGAWSPTGFLAGTDIFEVFESRPYGGGDDKLVTVRFLRGED